MTHLQIAAALQALRPGAAWKLSGDTIAGLDWLDAEQGKPTEAELAAEIAMQAAAAPIAAVKAEARRRILATFPDWKQANMTARGVELTFKVAQGQPLSEAETAEVGALQAAWGWIKAVRAASDAIEALDPIPADFAADAHWPA